MREFSVLVRRDDGLPDQWVAHCLNWDLITQGDSPAHALEMLCEAIGLAIEEDRRGGLDPSDLPPAPPDVWRVFARAASRCSTASQMPT